MKILFLSTIVPYPPQNGHAQRTYNLIREAAKYHEIHLVAFAQKDSELRTIEEMKNVCKTARAFQVKHKISKTSFAIGLLANLFSRDPYECTRYNNQEMRSAIRTLASTEQFDILHCDTLVLALYRKEVPNVPLVLVNHNVESILNRRRAEREVNPLAALYIRLQAKKLEQYERKICSDVQGCVVVSEHDRESLLRIVPECNPTVVSNGVDHQFFSPGPEEDVCSSSIVFCGGLYWMPNAEGIYWFATRILPLVLEVIPDATLSIIGANPPNKVASLHAPPQVMVTGFLDDVRPLIRKAGCVVVPLMVGGGSRLKILDALSMAKPVVSTTIGCEGLRVTHEKDILIHDTEENFARGVIRVMRNRPFAQSLGRQGRKLVCDEYGWEMLGKRMEDVYTQAVERH